MTIDKAIRVFSQFLNSSWPTVSGLLVDRDYTTSEDSINDWLQANWELLVERKVLKINEYLEVYGDGADYNETSSRILDPEKLPNFKVTVNSKNGNAILDLLNHDKVILEEAIFDKIIGFKDGFYILEPEFKYALVMDDKLDLERVVSLEDVEFDIKML